MPNEYPPAVPRKHMHTQKFAGQVSICEYLRETYHMTSDRDIRFRLRVIMAMGQAMNKRLFLYKGVFDECAKGNCPLAEPLKKVPENLYGEIK